MAQRLRALLLVFEVGFEVVDHGELVFDGFDDGFLFGSGRNGKLHRSEAIRSEVDDEADENASNPSEIQRRQQELQRQREEALKRAQEQAK